MDGIQENRAQAKVPTYAHQSVRDQFSRPISTETAGSDHRLEIAVLFTSDERTSAAIRRAAELASGLDANISLLDFQPVPHPLPLNNPPVGEDFAKSRLAALAESSPIETTGQVYWCRCRVEAIKSVLAVGSLIVIGGSRAWWPTWEAKLARKLRHAGYEVVLYKC